MVAAVYRLTVWRCVRLGKWQSISKCAVPVLPTCLHDMHASIMPSSIVFLGYNSCVSKCVIRSEADNLVITLLVLSKAGDQR